MAEPLIRMSGIVKRYSGVPALDQVSFEVRPGEVMGLVGENGAGKSTLLKILAGVVAPDAGRIEVDGAPVRLSSPRDAQRLGIAVIHQELSLAPDLPVAENILVGREPRTRWGLLDRTRAARRATELLGRLGVDVDPWTPAGRLSVARQQMVEIARALAADGRLIVMDEPTSALTEDEVDTLLATVERLRAAGVAVVYVSHRMREIFAVCDRITVLRDGRNTGLVETSATSPDQLVSLMVGREITALYGARAARPAGSAPVLVVRHLAAGPRVRDVSFHVCPGEIVALAGLVGSGRTETARAIFGADPATGGEIELDGRLVRFGHPAEAIRAGVGYLPEDRKSQGLFLDLTVRANVSVTVPAEIAPAGWYRPGREHALAERFRALLRVACPDVDVPVIGLSGGNQQKIALAKWLAVRPRVLLLDEPTRGVDVGAKAEIYRIVRELAAAGTAVVVISSELPEVLGLSDRIVVLHEGRSVGELDARTATEEDVVSLATGLASDARP